MVERVFGSVGVSEGFVVRSFRVKVMATDAQRRRAFALLVSAGDVWAWVIDRFHARARLGLTAANSVVEVWPDLRAHGAFGELSMHAAQDVAKAWSCAYFEVIQAAETGRPRASAVTEAVPAAGLFPARRVRAQRGRGRGAAAG